MKVFADPKAALEELRRRGLPDIFETLWSSTGLGPMGCLGRAPRLYFKLAPELMEDVPGASGLCPLWEQNGEAVTGSLPNGEFVRIYYEDAGNGDAAIERLAGDYKGLIATVLESVEEAGLQHWSERVSSALGHSA